MAHLKERWSKSGNCITEDGIQADHYYSCILLARICSTIGVWPTFYTILGMLIAFGVSVYSIQFLMGYVRRHDFKFFGYYRIILGVVVLAYFGITALAA